MMALEFELRPARPGDAAIVSDIFLAARKESLSYLLPVHTDEEIRSWIRETLIPSMTVWVAEAEAGVVGFFSVAGQKLEHLYVHAAYQGWGVGTSLLQKARALSPERLQLYTFVRNDRARRFYERRGFRAVAFGQDNEENEPDVLYEWSSR